jgi:two-component system, sensor histidine kinase PdtaS
MPTLAELTREHTKLNREAVAHLQRLVSEWGMLADLCFADLLLYVPVDEGRWLVVAQVRPATSQTLYISDWVGTWASEGEQAVLDRAFSAGDIVEDVIDIEGSAAEARMLAIPVVCEGAPIAVLTKEWSATAGRSPGELERTYLAIFERFGVMIAEGSFPFPGRAADSSAAPRVGDGAIVLDADARVSYASPNAVSALHRVGISANLVGQRLTELGFNDSPVRQAYERREPVIEEFDQTTDVTLLTRCLPIVSGGEVSGGVLLLRDVTELRRRDRLILTKDATIREIHHRVKNNLQTISSLLRLQARRLTSEEAKAAVNESVRRIRTIALVHETLSREPGEDVAFVEIVRPLLRLAEESLQSPDRPVRFRTRGDGGRLPATIATPLSVVLTELLQNAVDHGFRDGGRSGTGTTAGTATTGGEVVVLLDHTPTTLRIRVVDDGAGLAPDFDLDQATGLGLSIVRTLVTTELGGSIAMRPGDSADATAAELASGHAGTVVDLEVPLGQG